MERETPSAEAIRCSVSRLVAVWAFSILESMPRLMPARSDTSAIVRPCPRRFSRMAFPRKLSSEGLLAMVSKRVW